MKVAVCGGGTGGHTLPVLAVIKSLRRREKDIKIFFIGSRFGVESSLIPKMGIKYYGISVGKFRRYHKSKILNIIDLTTIFRNIADFFRFISGISEARRILLCEKPNILFAKGGYVSLPVGMAARLLKIPVVVHESDLVMGMANKRMSLFAEKVCVSFPVENFKDIKKEKLIETGNPIRDDVMMGNKERFLSSIGFDKDRKTIFLFGGSQGSLFLNETIIDLLIDILEKHQMIIVTGEKDADYVIYKTKDLPGDLKKYLKIYGFVTSEMADIYAAADLVISRAGSNTLFELAALGKPAILIPHNVSPGDHQFENARVFSRRGAAYIFKQETLTSKKLLHQINLLLSNDKELAEMSAKMRSMSDLSAADKVASVVFKVANEQIKKGKKK